MNERADEASGWLDDLMAGVWAPVLEPYGEGVHGWPGPALPWTVADTWRLCQEGGGTSREVPPKGVSPGNLGPEILQSSMSGWHRRLIEAVDAQIVHAAEEIRAAGGEPVLVVRPGEDWIIADRAILPPGLEYLSMPEEAKHKVGGPAGGPPRPDSGVPVAAAEGGRCVCTGGCGVCEPEG